MSSRNQSTRGAFGQNVETGRASDIPAHKDPNRLDMADKITERQERGLRQMGRPAHSDILDTNDSTNKSPPTDQIPHEQRPELQRQHRLAYDDDENEYDPTMNGFH